MDHSTDMIPSRTRVPVLAATLAALLAVTLWPAPGAAATLRLDRRGNRTNVDDEVNSAMSNFPAATSLATSLVPGATTLR